MSLTEPIDVGVIGVGNMGENHARVLSELQGADLVGVADADQERARDVAQRHATTVYGTAELIDRADGVIIAVPTAEHYTIGRKAIEAGTHLLIEKPFVTDEAEGNKLCQRAKAMGLTLQVGHIERFNPAVETLLGLIDPEDIVALRADRLGPPHAREVQDDVVLDLMIHDIDVTLALMGREPENLAAMSCGGGKHASVLCGFEGDVIGTLTASRLTQRKVRRLHVTTPERLITVNYLTQSIQIHRRSRPEYLQMDADVRYRHESLIERPLIESAEPLKRELEAFLQAITTGNPPAVDGEAALRALRVVWAIQSTLPRTAVEVSA